MKEKIRCIIKRPGEEAEYTVMDNALEAFQNAVGGYIETVTVCSDMVILCNEEGE